MTSDPASALNEPSSPVETASPPVRSPAVSIPELRRFLRGVATGHLVD